MRQSTLWEYFTPSLERIYRFDDAATRRAANGDPPGRFEKVEGIQRSSPTNGAAFTIVEAILEESTTQSHSQSQVAIHEGSQVTFHCTAAPPRGNGIGAKGGASEREDLCDQFMPDRSAMDCSKSMACGAYCVSDTYEAQECEAAAACESQGNSSDTSESEGQGALSNTSECQDDISAACESEGQGDFQSTSGSRVSSAFSCGDASSHCSHECETYGGSEPDDFPTQKAPAALASPSLQFGSLATSSRSLVPTVTLCPQLVSLPNDSRSPVPAVNLEADFRTHSVPFHNSAEMADAWYHIVRSYIAVADRSHELKVWSGEYQYVEVVDAAKMYGPIWCIMAKYLLKRQHNGIVESLHARKIELLNAKVAQILKAAVKR